MVARPAPWLRVLRWRGADSGAALRNILEEELAERAGLNWLAVAFGTGSLIYFTLPREPLFAALAAAALLFGAVASFGYWRGTTWRLAAVVAIVLAGAGAAKLRVDSFVGPEIERPTFSALSGRVVTSENRAELRPRIVLDRLRSTRAGASPLPPRIRVSIANRYGLPPIGARISLNARLAPVGGPVVPGGYDAHRAAFFDRIGGSGFLLGGWKEMPSEQASAGLLVAKLRAAIVQRIMGAEPNEAGAVAAALLVGERSGISEATNESLRISGLAHILAISGLHMMLVAGAVFFVVRALLALSPRMTLIWPIRKFAAIAALVAISVYLIISGAGTATVRAYVMALIMFLAILLDRPAISMRNLAIAAFVVLTLRPESVVEPGFQMSFAAVAALVAGWEFWHDRRAAASLADPDSLPGLRIVRVAWRAVIGVLVTTLLAGSATAPFAAYHFERVATYSLLGNLLAAPLVSLIIMPFGLLSMIAMPFGLEAYPLAVMTFGINRLIGVASWVASLPGAEMRAPPIAPLCLLLIVAGMLWLCLWRRAWRLLGVPLIAAGLLLIPMLIDRPDILVAPDGRAVAVRDRDGTLRVSGARAGSYAVEQFFDKEKSLPSDGAALKVGVRCDKRACLLDTATGLQVSHVLDPAAFLEDCARATIIVTALSAPADCAAPLVIDANALKRSGAEAVRIEIENGKPKFRVTTELSGTPRPWQAQDLLP